MEAPLKFAYEAMGAQWEVTIWDELSDKSKKLIDQEISDALHQFEQTYSRFLPSSLVRKLSSLTGKARVPEEFIKILKIYQKLYDLSGGKCTPLVGNTLKDLGYDEKYSLKPKDMIRPTPLFTDVVNILDEEHLELTEPVLFDFGAVGKGYCVDILTQYLREKEIERFLVNGSGDIYYEGNGKNLRCGLEHPHDTSKVIGVVELGKGALCASAGNRRSWGTYHHTIDPHTLQSPTNILATWVTAGSAAIADGLATCVFLTQPEQYINDYNFEYCILNPDFTIKHSPKFPAEFF